MVCLLVIIRKEVISQVKAFRIFGRSIRDAIKSITRNFSLSMASILCDMITLIIVSVAIIIACNVNNATKSIESEMNIVVYFNKNSTEEDGMKAIIKNIELMRLLFLILFHHSCRIASDDDIIGERTTDYTSSTNYYVLS